ncbi:MAG: type IV pilus modification protein PilV [Burkholderiales bacterium]|nr:type IV pilus modification protein PilV [Burkholderiales bacterium]
MNTQRPSRTRTARRGRQGGMMLIEALIAILIFSIGILGIVGLQATAVQQSSDATYRAQAAQLAQQLLGQMWTGNRTATNLQAQYNCTSAPCSSPGAGYLAWYNQVSAALPGIATNTALQPQVSVDNAGVVTISLFWQQPSDVQAGTTHRYDVQAQIGQ